MLLIHSTKNRNTWFFMQILLLPHLRLATCGYIFFKQPHVEFMTLSVLRFLACVKPLNQCEWCSLLVNTLSIRVCLCVFQVFFIRTLHHPDWFISLYAWWKISSRFHIVSHIFTIYERMPSNLVSCWWVAAEVQCLRGFDFVVGV